MNWTRNHTKALIVAIIFWAIVYAMFVLAIKN